MAVQYELLCNAAAFDGPQTPTTMNRISVGAHVGKVMTLIKYRESSRWYQQYGAYALTDDRNHIHAYGLDLDGFAAELAT